MYSVRRPTVRLANVPEFYIYKQFLADSTNGRAYATVLMMMTN